MIKKDYLVSAIVSVYNCERFIAGCLEDLEQQTIADKLEIVVVNSSSQQNEENIIKKFLERYDNIVYIKTENRETVYQSWNRGIEISSGKYITNANSDDRHKKDAFEVMIKVLESDEKIDLVYADDNITETENETFENNKPVDYLNQRESNAFELLKTNIIGPHPMWRKNLHNKFGYFDEKLKVAADYEFWLRISQKCKFRHIKDYLGLYLRSPDSVEHRNREIYTLETEEIVNKYMVNSGLNKNLKKIIKKVQSNRVSCRGYIYLRKRQLFLSLKTFLLSLHYDWSNIESYKGILACFLPSGTTKILIKYKRIILTWFRVRCETNLRGKLC